MTTMILTPISSTSRAAVNLAQSKQSIFFFTRNFPINMSSSRSAAVHQVPGLSWEEMERVTAEQIFQSRYSSSPNGGDIRRGKGVAIVWFRNDLRVLDNEALYKAWVSSEAVLPVYCVDPRLFSTTHYFGFPKTGALRAQFIVESLDDLKRNLMKRGLNLLIQHGEPEEILPSLAKTYNAHTVKGSSLDFSFWGISLWQFLVQNLSLLFHKRCACLLWQVYAQKETCSEELNVERAVSKNLRDAIQPSSNSKNATRLELIWGCTMYHIDDLTFNCKDLPDVYTQFRKSVESKSVIRNCIKIPTSLGPSPIVAEWGSVPEVTQFGLQPEKVSKGMKFVGGETAALSRVHEYFWKKDLLKIYKETRNGMLGPDYSTKFSPWLASGCLSPRLIHAEVKRYEKERLSNASTYWVLFELIWRDYFRFLSIKVGNLLFHPGKTEFCLFSGCMCKYFSVNSNFRETSANTLTIICYNTYGAKPQSSSFSCFCPSVSIKQTFMMGFFIGFLTTAVLFLVPFVSALGGPRKLNSNWSKDQKLFDAWRNGQTGYPLIDANMKELLTTGFMSNRGRQIVCSFLVRDMGIDWRMGAEWFERCLLDYDPCSNYGNWTYGAGVGNDPREDRYFSIPKQAQNYDPEGEFVAYWLPELRPLPKEKRHSPGLSYIKPLVPLKHGYTTKSNHTQDKNRWKGRKF